eukprot:SAG31_NODE_15478_length_753_cov_0.980122_1_plen_37_part_01
MLQYVGPGDAIAAELSDVLRGHGTMLSGTGSAVDSGQ